MKKYLVTIHLITGYYESEEKYDNPKLKAVEFEVEAANESKAIELAKDFDESKLSVYETFAEEI